MLLGAVVTTVNTQKDAEVLSVEIWRHFKSVVINY